MLPIRTSPSGISSKALHCRFFGRNGSGQPPIRLKTESAITLGEGVIYPVLHTLEREGALTSRRKTVNGRVNAMIVPGSGIVKEQAEAEGLDKIFVKAGFEWREPGCSMCLAMNPDKLKPGERCASTSNRNFEGRQGYKGRTHLVSPAMAAAAAIAGHFVDIREWH